MSIHEFKISFQFPESSKSDCDIMRGLGDLRGSGCYRVTVGYECTGSVIMCFSRESHNIRAAVMGATRDVREVVPGNYTIAVTYDGEG